MTKAPVIRISKNYANFIKVFSLISLITFIAGCALYNKRQLDEKYGASSTDNRIPGADSAVLAWQDVRNIIDRRCVVCHGCYDSPCQLKLTNFRGLERGASKNKVYNNRRILAVEPTRDEYSRNIREWRQKDFFPVLNERKQSPKANIQASVLARILTLKQKHPQPNIRKLRKKFNFGLKRDQQCSSIEEFSRFERKYPLWGMPFGLPGLSTFEHNTIMNWIRQGAKIRAQSNKIEKIAQEIVKWENFLNNNSLKYQLMGRYLFEHLFLASLYFSDIPDSPWLRLVRSKTPPGEAVQIISTRRPYDDPGVERVYYRFQVSNETRVQKTHLSYALNKEKFALFARLFIDNKQKVSRLPSYDAEQSANPFITYRDIPVNSRYRFLLDEAKYFVGGFIKGPVCRGQLALNVINDHFWVFFVNPNTNVFEKSAAVLGKDGKSLSLPSAEQSNALPLTTWLKYKNAQNQYLRNKSQFLNKYLKPQDVDLKLIWDGEKSNDNAALTIFRNFDSATVEKGLLGEAPKTAWMIDYPMFERIYYLLVAGYDVFGNVGHHLNTRLYMDFLRMEGEFNFLTLLPKKNRIKERDYWYRDVGSNIKDYIFGAHVNFHEDTGITYKTSEPKTELYGLLKKRLKDVLNNGSSKINPNYSFLKKLNTIQGELASSFSELTFVLVKSKSRSIEAYTIILHKAHSNISSLLFEESQRLPNEDKLLVLPGLIGAYPNAFIELKENALEEFVTLLLTAKNAKTIGKVINRFRVSRTAKNFWKFSDQLHDSALQASGRNYGIFDYSRLEIR